MTKSSLLILTLSTLTSTLTGCMVGGESDAPMSLDDFKATYVSKTGDGAQIYDWDVQINDEQVGRLYDLYVQSQTTGETESMAVANRFIWGGIDRWPADTATSLTFCVSNAFGSRKAAVVAAMQNATSAWQTASETRVRFVYQSAWDGACNVQTPVVFDVVPYSANDGVYAAAFFPSEGRANHEVHVNLVNAFNGDFPLAGILRHELGHALGLRHETTRPEAVVKYGWQCFENNLIATLTPYDDWSVMVTPACVGAALKNTTLGISTKDATGIRLLYQ